MENQTKQGNTKGALIKFNAKAKTTIAAAMDARQTALYERGEELGADAGGYIGDFKVALGECRDHGDRMILRAGFVVAYRGARGCNEAAAIAAFNYYARSVAPHTSRKAKANAKVKGRPEKTATGKGKTLAPQETAQRLANVLHYIAKAQAKYAGDGDMLEVLGEIAAIAGGSK